jgi:hypothetical protein
MGCIPTLGIFAHLLGPADSAGKITERRPVYFVLIERSINKEYYLRQFVAIDAVSLRMNGAKRHCNFF